MEITVDGGPAPPELLWRKHVALLVYLARSPARGRSRDHLIGLLWPDKPEGAARHSLNEALRVLRRALGDAGLETAADQVRLAPGLVQLDTERLDTLAAGDPRDAAALVGGEFLEGFGVAGASGFEDWLASERARWRERGVAVLARCAAAELEAGHGDAAVDAARRALALDPTAESAARALIRSLALAGDRAGALDAYARFADRLRGAVGAEPTPELRALAERVRRQRLSAPAPHALPPRRRTPLVEREEPLDRLARVWEACRGGPRAAVALIEGDAGTGKTRLAEELLARARLDGAAVVVVRAVEADLRDPGATVLGLAGGGLLDAPGLAGGSPAALAAFAARLPDWADRFRDAAGRAAPAPLAHALRDVLRAVSAETPVVLLVDDAHWADRDSLLDLGAALRDLAGAPLLAAFTLSPEPARPELDELRARLGRELPGDAVRLAPLGRDALAQLARWALPHYSAAQLDRLVRRLSTDTAGLPLLAVELVAAVADGLDLAATGGAWPEELRTLDQTLPGGLPEAVVGAIRVGFRRLSDAARTALAAAAVLGDRVPAERLAHATGLAPEALRPALDELEWHRWLVWEGRGYSFLARVVREVVARDMLTPGQRRRIEESGGAGGAGGGGVVSPARPG